MVDLTHQNFKSEILHYINFEFHFRHQIIEIWSRGETISPTGPSAQSRP